jgi:opacity protein-like surface antigen
VAVTPPGYNTTCNFHARYLATLTGRLGYVWGRALWYVKAGGAATRETIDVTCNNSSGVGIACFNAAGTGFFFPVTATGNINRFGFTAGYGVEFALTPKWSARAETSYYNFGTRSVTLSDGVVVSSKLEEISTKIGVNYKLN